MSGLPKDSDAFLAALAEVNKGFQQHVRNERRELLPAVLKVLSDEEAATVAADIEGTVRDAEHAKSQEERAQAKRDAEQSEQAQHLGNLLLGARPLQAGDLSELAERWMAHGTRMITRTMDAGGLALAPVHRQATANARRLSA